jgi:transposase
MKIEEYDFSPGETEKLRKYRDEQSNFSLKIRLIAVLMIALGSDIRFVASVIGKCEKTVGNWLRKYVTEGIDNLNSLNYTAPESYLSRNQINQVIIWVTFENPANTKIVREYIMEKFGITYTVEGVRQLLRKQGLGVIRPKSVPGDPPSVEDQTQFISDYFDMKASSVPGTVTLFGDGMHLIHQNVPALCWGDPLLPPVLETNSGRKRLNILGAYNPDTHSLIHLTGEENCDADRVIRFLDLIIRSHRSAPLINLIVDNAPYFHAKKVTEWLEDHQKLNLRFLPSYAPNLNLIERFWKFTKEKLVRNK